MKLQGAILSMNNRQDEKRITLLVTTIGSFLAPFMGAAVNIALPKIGAEFSLDTVSLGWVAIIYILAGAMVIIPFGRAADIYGRKRIFTLGMSIFAVSSLLCAAVSSAALLIAFRALQGMGSAMVFGTAVAILASVFSDKERGRVLGVNVSSVYLGLSLGPFLGGVLTQQLGWRSLFLINGIMGLLVVALIIRKLKGEWAEAKGESLDIPGSLTYGLSLAALMYGLSLLPVTHGLWGIIAGIAGLTFFLSQQGRLKNPLLDMTLFLGNTVFTFSSLAALINYSATFACGFILSIYLQLVRGMNPQQAGFILVAQPIIMAVFSPLTGRLSDYIEPRVLASTGMFIAVIGLTLMATFGPATPMASITGSLMLLGLGFALFSSPNTNAIMGSVAKRHYGIASATVGTMRYIGQMLSLGLATAVISIYVGSVKIAAADSRLFISGMKVAFIIFAILCFIGVFISLARGRLYTEATIKNIS
jgi:EmrB/QacA subfamily drug resistance transporter